MAEIVSFQYDLDNHVHLINDVKRYVTLISGTEMLQRQCLSQGDKRNTLDFIAVCLSIEPQDHVVVAEGDNQLLIAKARPTCREDEKRAASVVKTLCVIREDCRIERVFSALVEQDYGRALIQERVRKLALLSTKPNEVLQAIEDRGISEGTQRLHSIMSLAAALSAMGNMDKDSLESLCLKAAQLNTSIPEFAPPHLSEPSSLAIDHLHQALQDVVGFVRTILSLLKYLKARSVAPRRYCLIPTATLPGSTPLEINPRTMLRQIVSSRGFDLEVEYEAAWSQLMEIYSLEDSHMFSSSTVVHPELTLILHEGRNGPSVEPRIIGSNVDVCFCCQIWIDHYNKRFKTTWQGRDGRYIVPTDWAAPNKDCSYGSDPVALQAVNQALLTELKRKLSNFICERVEEIQSCISYLSKREDLLSRPSSPTL